MGICGEKDVTDGCQDNNSRYEAPQNIFTQCKQKSRSAEIRMSSGHIRHKPERQGIKQ